MIKAHKNKCMHLKYNKLFSKNFYYNDFNIFNSNKHYIDFYENYILIMNNSINTSYKVFKGKQNQGKTIFYFYI